MEIYLHRPDGDLIPVVAIARPAYRHRITAESGLWTTWADETPRDIATIDELHVDLADLLGLAKSQQDTVIVEGQERLLSFVFPGGSVPLLEVRSDPDVPAERDRTTFRSMDERDRAARASLR